MDMLDELLETINMLDWHHSRMLSYIPPHFTKLKLSDHGDRVKLMYWLQENTQGRFGIEKIINLDEGNNKFRLIDENLRIGFEDPAEATAYAVFFI